MGKNDRYSRHYKLKGFGEDGQTMLQKSKVLVIGAGGLGCPALQYLVAGGVGTIGIVDYDNIELSNLQRQTLYNTNDIGLPKAQVAAEKLRLLNPEIKIREYVLNISTENAIGLIEDFDVIVDCTDNFITRYLLSDICMLLDKPLVFGAIYQYEGQLAVFNVENDKGIKTTYRHLFPSPPSQLDAPDCNEAGVLGVLPGVIGTLQATETIKLLTGIGQVLSNKLMTINLLDNQTLILDIPVNMPPNTEYPTSLQAFEETDYASHCATTNIEGINVEELMNIHQNDDVLIIDVRNLDERPKLTISHVQIPLSELSEKLTTINKKQVIVVCQSGKRSLSAVQFLQDKIGTEHHISHLKGGVSALVAYNHG
jgi:molybdopterin/thiamine biosynthesis adenylyltransferase/rhodanese-related sulfurtransferase